MKGLWETCVCLTYCGASEKKHFEEVLIIVCGQPDTKNHIKIPFCIVKGAISFFSVIFFITEMKFLS